MDLFEFFKEHESKLHERPSEQAWKKLEGRLERRRVRKRRMIRFLQLGAVVAALVLLLLTAGLALGYLIMGFVDSTWNVWIAVGVAVLCALFVQAGEGAVFAVVPLIKRRMTGQIAGMAGAYGNVGAVVYLTILSLVDYHTFFFVIAGSAILGLIALMFMKEPKGHMAEVREDGTVELISIDRAVAH